MIGLYPVTGQSTFLIHSPWYKVMTIDLGNNKSLKIISKGGDGNGDINFYVQSLRVNGQKWTQNWLTWNDIFANGGIMEFVLGPYPVQWATGPFPPQPSPGFGICRIYTIRWNRSFSMEQGGNLWILVIPWIRSHRSIRYLLPLDIKFKASTPTYLHTFLPSRHQSGVEMLLPKYPAPTTLELPLQSLHFGLLSSRLLRTGGNKCFCH